MPKTSRIDVIRIRMIHIGATYLIMTVNSFFLLKGAVTSTSSINACGEITYPTKIQVKKAPMGIRTLLLIKSKKSIGI